MTGKPKKKTAKEPVKCVCGWVKKEMSGIFSI